MVAAMSPLAKVTEPLEGALAFVEVKAGMRIIRELPAILGVMDSNTPS
jgi:hypothetical protein